MRGGRRMDRQAARVADIGDVIEHFARIDETAAGLLATGEFKTDETAQSALEIFLGALAVHAGLYRRMDHAGDLRPLFEILDNVLGVLGMLGYAKRQGLQSLQRQEGVERRNRRAEVAQQRDAGLDDV